MGRPITADQEHAASEPETLTEKYKETEESTTEELITCNSGD